MSRAFPSHSLIPDTLYRDIVEGLPGVVYLATVVPVERVLYVSPQVEPLLGIAPQEWLSNPRLWLEMLHPDDVGRVLHEQAHARVAGEPFRSEYRLVTRSGDTIWIEHRMRALASRGGEALLLGTMQDVTSRKRVEDTLRELAYVDELTGLYNRRGFLNVAEQQLRLSERNGRGAVLLYLDVDALKVINDTLGHHAGDQALLEVAGLLRRSFRTTDVLARNGGDEFAVWAVETDLDRGDLLQERLLRNLEEMNRDPDRSYTLSFSVGHTYCDPSERASLQTLLKRADEGMYRRKRGI